MRIAETVSIARSLRQEAVTVRATGAAGTYLVEELHHGEGRLTGTVTRGESGLWFARTSTWTTAPYRTRGQAIRGLGLEFASVRLAERIARHPDVCGQDLRLWRDEDIALAEKGLPEHCVLPPGHRDGHSVRPRATGCSCSPDPDTGELHDDDGWRCSHG